MSGFFAARRNSFALGLSALIHLVLVALLLNQAYRPYNLPVPPTDAIEMEIERVPEPITLPPPPPPPPVLKEQPVKPPVTTPPVTTPTPQPQVVVKVRPVPAAVSAKPTPLVAKAIPAPSLTATPLFTPTPEPLAPPAPKAAPAPVAAAPTPAAPRLNLHKPEKEAPAGVPTLPMAPSPAQRSGGGAPPLGAQEPGMGSSRLQGLAPFPPGAFPSGGPGLRGSLVGCANSEAVALSSVERAHCNERFGVDVAKAPHLDGMSPAKRAAFDKTVDQQNSWKAYRDSIPPNGTPPGPNGQGRLGDLQPQGLLQNVLPHN